ncbi:MAG TPA: HlyD family secretion protein [Minicystis sp.]|nr:HlyD family secretion protein [Minicystis sp.]
MVARTAESPAEVEVVAPTAAPKKASRTKLVLGLLLGAAALGGGGYWVTHHGLESTDDAQVDADVVSVPAKTGGTVAKVLFTDNQHVKAGDVLVELDGDTARARLAEAEAKLHAAEANAAAAEADARVAETSARANKKAAEAGVHGAASSATASRQQIAEAEAGVASAKSAYDKAELDLSRSRELASTGAIAKAALDQAQSTYDAANAALEQARAHLATMRATTSQAVSRVEEANARFEQSSDVDAIIEQARARAAAARAQVATAKAARDLAQLDVSYTHVLAPADGIVSKRTVAVGQLVAAGQPIVQLVPDGKVWITANFKETQISHMRVGQPADFTLDAFPGKTIGGEVESFSAATGAKFTLLPPDNASGNYTKVVQRVPVRIRVKDVPQGVALRPGLSAELTVDTRK